MSDEYRGYYEILDELGNSDNLNDRRIVALVNEMSDWKGFRYMTDDMGEEDAQEFFDALRAALNKFDEKNG